MNKISEVTTSRSALSTVLFSVRRHIFLIVFFSIFVNMLMLTGPLFMLQVYDRVIVTRSVETLSALCLLAGGLFLVLAVLDSLRGLILNRLGATIQTNLDRALLPQLATGRVSIRDNHDTQFRNSCPLSAADELKSFFNSPLPTAIVDLFWSPFFFLMIFLFHLWLGWVALIGSSFLFVATIFYQYLTRMIVQKFSLERTQATEFYTAVISGTSVARANGMVLQLAQRWREMRNYILIRDTKAADIATTGGAITRVGRLFLQSALLALGAYLVLLDQLSAGAMVAASVLVGRALAPVEVIMSGWPRLLRIPDILKSIRTLQQQHDNQAKSIHSLHRPPRITVNNLIVHIPNRNDPVLSRLSFSLESGQTLGILGDSGSGKSTLLRAVLGLETHAEQCVLWNDLPVSCFTKEQKGTKIGYLPQTPCFFPGTIAQNISRFEPEPIKGDIITATKAAGVHDLIITLNDGYDTRLDHPELRLSGGQMQRLGLARALYGSPCLLILDEPNSALDTEGSMLLDRALSECKSRGTTIILTTHRPAAIAQCDLLLCLQNGHLSSFGSRDDVLSGMIKNARALKPNIERMNS